MYLHRHLTTPKPGLKSRLFTVLISTGLAFPCSAQISFDAAVDGLNNGGTTSSLTWNHTVTGSHPFLQVCLMGDTITGGHDDITSITYNGQAMTLAAKYTGANSFFNRYTYAYFLVNAPTGTHAISVTSTATHYLLGVSGSYTGTSGTQPDNTATFPASGNTTFTTSITTVANNAWVITCDGGNLTNAPSMGCTLRVVGAQFNEPSIFDSNAAVSPPGSNSCSTNTNVINSNDVHIMMSIAPFGASTKIHHRVTGG